MRWITVVWSVNAGICLALAGMNFAVWARSRDSQAQLPFAIAAAEARTWAFVCPDATSYVVRATAGEAWVFRPGSGVRLEEVPGAVPPRYAQGDTTLVIDGERGILSEPGGKAPTCINDRRRAIWEKAKLDGVDFRGVGNEPPWVLEIRERSRVVLVTDYGAHRIERPLPPGTSDAASRTTRWDAGDLQIEITAAECHDTMSGEAFGSQVTVRWQGKTLRGCGRPLH